MVVDEVRLVPIITMFCPIYAKQSNKIENSMTHIFDDIIIFITTAAQIKRQPFFVIRLQSWLFEAEKQMLLWYTHIHNYVVVHYIYTFHIIYLVY